MVNESSNQIANFFDQCVARLEGFEPPTHGLEVRSSIHLSYRRLISKYMTSLNFNQGKL